MSTSLAPRPSADRIAALTPPDRNRYADLLRVASLLVVVIGHWLMAAVTVADGQLSGQNVLVSQPWSRWLTWIFQVMPVFFFVGGYANATGWASARQRGDGYVQWLRVRAARLLRPAVPVVALWVPLAGLLALAGIADDVLRLGTGAVMVPLWFLAVYIVIVALTPVTVWLHERFGVAGFTALLATAALVDAAHLAGVPLVGWTNFVWVWGAVHQLGYLWRDGTLTRSGLTAPALALAGFGALVVLTLLAGYPVSMLGVDGAARTNNAPPSLALVALGVGQVGMLLMLRRGAERWLARTRVWAAVATAGSVAMTLYLWHMTAMVAGIGIAYGLGLLPESAFDGTWWMTRPVWIVFLMLLLAPLVVVLRRYERVGPAPAVRTRPETIALSVAGVIGVAAGLGLLILRGVHVPSAPLGVPVGAVGVLAGGLLALGVIRRQRS